MNTRCRRYIHSAFSVDLIVTGSLTEPEATNAEKSNYGREYIIHSRL